jgi:uncharacterized protein YjiS (DUF1127 family)
LPGSASINEGAILAFWRSDMNRTLASPIRIDIRSRRPGGLLAFVEAVFAWQDRARQRQLLARMDDRLLRDMGLTRADIAIEADKPFWRA